MYFSCGFVIGHDMGFVLRHGMGGGVGKEVSGVDGAGRMYGIVTPPPAPRNVPPFLHGWF